MMEANRRMITKAWAEVEDKGVRRPELAQRTSYTSADRFSPPCSASPRVSPATATAKCNASTATLRAFFLPYFTPSSLPPCPAVARRCIPHPAGLQLRKDLLCQAKKHKKQDEAEYQEAFKEAQRAGHFSDPVFEASKKSLCFNAAQRQEGARATEDVSDTWKAVVWKRPREFLDAKLDRPTVRAKRARAPPALPPSAPGIE